MENAGRSGINMLPTENRAGPQLPPLPDDYDGPEYIPYWDKPETEVRRK